MQMVVGSVWTAMIILGSFRTVHSTEEAIPYFIQVREGIANSVCAGHKRSPSSRRQVDGYRNAILCTGCFIQYILCTG